MKTKLMAVLALLVLPVFVFVGVAGAQAFRSGDSAAVAANEQLDSSAWLAGNSVNVAGDVNGDVFCAGRNITISGNVTGDVLCAGQTVTVSGKVDGNVRIAGQTVIISGDVKGSVSAAGQDVTLDTKSMVGRDVSLAGQALNVHGNVGRDLVLAADSAVVDATVGRNLTSHLQTLTLATGTKVSGNVDYTSPDQANIASGAHIVGQTKYTHKEQEQHNNGYNFGWMLMWSAMLFVTALILALLFPRVFDRSAIETVKTPAEIFLALGVGLLVTIVTPIVAFLIMLTVFGLPFALVVLLAWVLILALSGAFTAYYIGRAIWTSATNIVAIMAAGALILGIALMIPYLNTLVSLLSTWFGTGIIVLELKKHLRAPNYTAKPLK